MSDEPAAAVPAGTVSVVVEVTLTAEDDEPGAADPPDTTEATDVAVAVVGGAAKLVGKVIGAAWDVIKPSDDSSSSGSAED